MTRKEKGKYTHTEAKQKRTLLCKPTLLRVYCQGSEMMTKAKRERRIGDAEEIKK